MERFDNYYINIAREAGGIENLLDSFFSFMFRRTDFYYECEPNDNMGFPPGVAEMMVLNIFRKYQAEQYKKHPKKSSEEYQKKLAALKQEKQKASQETTAQPKQDQKPLAEAKEHSEPIQSTPKVEAKPNEQPQQNKGGESKPKSVPAEAKEFSDIR
jgi:hypothetical protein